MIPARVSPAPASAPMGMDSTPSALLALAARWSGWVCDLGADVPAELPTPDLGSGSWWEYVTGFGWVERRPVVVPAEVPERETAVAA